MEDLKHKIAHIIDHTLLKPDATQQQIEVLCQEALENEFASVCVLPYYVPLCSQILQNSLVKVCTVIGFPLGATLTEAKIAEAHSVLKNGAQELDMVLNIGALKNGSFLYVQNEIDALAKKAHENGAILKVIIETCLLSEEEKLKACELVTNAGADFIKTSTGFSTGGATIEDVVLLKNHVGQNVRVKASGGIRDLKAAAAMIEAGAERLGTSSGVKIVREHLSGEVESVISKEQY
ncbi:MAG TPA: deoxyribose-phosphate aldolase [Patescibacteria group bacterium]|nr:deoxyribose-phosphate aldolase [Patescibacteria group bacterium]